MDCMEEFFRGYSGVYEGAGDAIGRCHEITGRGRYR